ncbi:MULTISPECIES: bifunctional methylenetetrahydrofolate dehydrogenase/methenyltetrahydrofolate cyclohydrolase FolD [unclassified Paenibacillus]|uniref:bifunctional methylenetetrahydrofolate dehydrogenase/methenyltetrahydrofolate cyclohydrolase FolD n=1 Tax=unclassified Paenibacillus TaxID=185978 RepID=UPI001AE1F9B7|nr:MULTISPECIES: bifunctional methylenetetrahydrofolate dehydrogenase/methenyltetrahydrofolate cyclohydrolase FolD [unclassified Paenibacillus]MBP1155139.1 methylenetetrahydrofolate dehydrogenase (NADP+)/methenyltetrahydrofolate cyclohydrolase [Paenibacillus sp. PvP091]MBP1169477.1 methylenetetrahydrofolate dehydrogenase (NADP+)/methenyltetrahydrofolate cyclohydrolase [Paenibacillus sp. PvR098]MBP2440505.1 methylenetetrahydrofolate dehydrogenase (NADP+)/methenyltetrahydrofolate cyclohydrolase [P
MSAQVINGKEIVSAYRAQIKEQVEQLTQQGVRPGLAVVIVGDDPASHVYVRNKAKACEEAGMHSEVYTLPEQTPEAEVIGLISKLNEDSAIHGILVQSPLPKHISEERVVEVIAVEKDVDCFHPVNVGNLMIGKEGPAPCTPAGVIEILKKIGVDIAGKHAVVVGRSNIVGKPMAILFLRENATVTVCHSRTKNMEEITRQADILVAAVGKAKMINRKHVKPGAVVIDVGINRLDTGKLAGDVDFDDVLDTASYVTPVPGCVGPMTITMLLRNTLEAAQRAAGAHMAL